MPPRDNLPSERVVSEALMILRDPAFPQDEGWGGFMPTPSELLRQATNMAIRRAYGRGDKVSGSGWQTCFTETSKTVAKLIGIQDEVE